MRIVSSNVAGGAMPWLRRAASSTARAVEGSTARLLWLAGPPGSGKTRAVSLLAASDRVRVVDLSGARHPGPALRRALGLASDATASVLAASLSQSDVSVLVLEQLDAAPRHLVRALVAELRSSWPQRIIGVRRLPPLGVGRSPEGVVWAVTPRPAELPPTLRGVAAALGPWPPGLMAMASERDAMATDVDVHRLVASPHRVAELLSRTRKRAALRAWIQAVEREHPGVLGAHRAAGPVPDHLRDAAIVAGVVGPGQAAFSAALSWWQAANPHEGAGIGGAARAGATTQEIRLTRDGTRLVLPDGREVEVALPRTAPQLLAVLARAAHRSPRRPWVSAAALFRAAWRGEVASRRSMRLRVQQVIRHLRDLGLRPWLLLHERRYGLAGVRVVWMAHAR